MRTHTPVSAVLRRAVIELEEQMIVRGPMGLPGFRPVRWEAVPDLQIGGWAVAEKGASADGPYLMTFARDCDARHAALLDPVVGSHLLTLLRTAALLADEVDLVDARSGNPHWVRSAQYPLVAEAAQVARGMLRVGRESTGG